MSSVTMVATSTTCETPEVLAARLRGLVDAGWDARLVCKGERWSQAEELRDPAIAGRVEPISGQRRLERRLAKLSPDLIHFHAGGAAGKAAGLCERVRSRIAVSLRPDGMDLGEPGIERIWPRGALFTFPDAALLERAVSGGCPPERSALLSPVLAEAEAVAAAPGERREVGHIRLVSAGPLVWERGLEHSLHAVRLAVDRGVDCTYRIVHGGDHLVAVGFSRHALGLSDLVQMSRDDCGVSTGRELEGADLFLDAAVADGTSDAPLTAAQALGVPFVATEREGLDGDAGVAVPRRDPAATADAIVSLAGDPGLRARMGAAGRAASGAAAAPGADLSRLRELYERALRD